MKCKNIVKVECKEKSQSSYNTDVANLRKAPEDSMISSIQS